MDLKPLSYRLLNEQTPVHFALLAVSEDSFGTLSVVVQEKDSQYAGPVQILPGCERKFAKELEEYEDYLELDEAKREKTDPVPQPSVEISRTSHEEFPYMR